MEVVDHIVRDKRSEDAHEHHREPIDRGIVGAQSELKEQHDREERAHHERCLCESQFQIRSEKICSGLADRGGKNLDYPKEEGYLGDFVEHSSCGRTSCCS